MNRVSTLIIGALFAVAAVEFGLLGASASGLTGGDGGLPPVSERVGVVDTPTPLMFVTVTPTPSPTPCDGPCPPTDTPTYTITPCVSEVCITPTPHPPTRTPTPCSGPCPPTPTPFSPPYCEPLFEFCPTPTPQQISPPECDSETQFCPTVPPSTPIPPVSPPQLSPPSIDATGIDIRANPLTIECNGSDRTAVTVRLFDANGDPVPDGTWVYFSAYNGYADPWSAQTNNGYAETMVSYYGDIFPYGPNLIVESGLLQAGIRIRCTPQSDGVCPPTWPESPPPSPGCPEPTPTPYPCNPSPGSDPLSPPCEAEPPCAVSPPSVSPPCEEPPASPPTAFELQLDCDTLTSGVQTYCLAAPSSTHDVAVVLRNLSGRDIGLAAFNFIVNNGDTVTLSPLPGANNLPPQLNDNPDFNDAALSEAGWTCLPVIPNLTPGGSTSASLLSCFNAAGSAQIADGESLVLGTVHYGTGATPNGPAFLSIVEAAFYSAGDFLEIGSCNPTIYMEMNCHGALVEVPYPSPPNGPIATSTRPSATATRGPSTRTPAPTTRTSVPTATRPARTATVEATRTPTVGDRCADVNDDGRVTRADIHDIVRRVQRGPYIAKYDINRNGRLGASDVAAAIRQYGRRC